MAMANEKRNWLHGIGTTAPLQLALFDGVGGRQAVTPHRRRGGGYQNKCTVLNFSPDEGQKKRDPRLDELREMGLQRVWLDVAEEIGVDAFLKVWRSIAADAQVQQSIENYGRMMVPILSYSAFLRYQRNRYAESLLHSGLNNRDIHKKLNEQLGEKISMTSIVRITTRARKTQEQAAH